MPYELTELDKKLLDIIQTDFPIAPRPYLVLADKLGITEQEAFECVCKLEKKDVIRRLGANFQSSKLGFVSTLCAAKVPPEILGNFIERVNAEPGVTHNYERNNQYNIWFTLIAPSREAVKNTLDAITKDTGIKIMDLPATHFYKIKVDFKMSDDGE